MICQYWTCGEVCKNQSYTSVSCKPGFYRSMVQWHESINRPFYLLMRGCRWVRRFYWVCFLSLNLCLFFPSRSGNTNKRLTGILTSVVALLLCFTVSAESQSTRKIILIVLETENKVWRNWNYRRCAGLTASGVPVSLGAVLQNDTDGEDREWTASFKKKIHVFPWHIWIFFYCGI